MLTSESKVLIVDDEPSIRKAMHTTLSGLGFEIEEAVGGEQAVSLVRSEHYDAALLDINMPGIGGIETCRALRQLVPQLPILMLTVRDHAEDKIEALDAEFSRDGKLLLMFGGFFGVMDWWDLSPGGKTGRLPQRLAQPRVVAERGDDLGRGLLRFKKPPDESLRVRSKRIGLMPRLVAHPQRLGVPQADGPVARAGGQGLAVGAEGQRPDVKRVPREPDNHLPPGQVPQPHRPVAAGRHQARALGVEGRCVHGFGVPVQFLAFPCAHIPHPDDAVLTAGHEAAAVRAEGDRVDRACVAGEPGSQLMRLRVPQAHGLQVPIGAG